MIGYNYMGGHTNTPWGPAEGYSATWTLPPTHQRGPRTRVGHRRQRWSPGYGKTLAPHGAGGPILKAGDFANASAEGASSESIGAKGGNVGKTDGSVEWKAISQMQVYRGSLKWDTAGCTAAW